MIRQCDYGPTVPAIIIDEVTDHRSPSPLTTPLNLTLSPPAFITVRVKTMKVREGTMSEASVGCSDRDASYSGTRPKHPAHLPDAMGSLRLGDKPYIKAKAGLNEPLSPLDGVGRAIALYEFKAVEVS